MLGKGCHKFNNIVTVAIHDWYVDHYNIMRLFHTIIMEDILELYIIKQDVDNSLPVHSNKIMKFVERYDLRV